MPQEQIMNSLKCLLRPELRVERRTQYPSRHGDIWRLILVAERIGNPSTVDSAWTDGRIVRLFGSQYLNRIDRCRAPSRDVTGHYGDHRQEHASNHECDRVPWFYSKELACNET